MEITIHIDEPYTALIPPQKIEQALTTTLKIIEHQLVESVSIIIIDSEAMQALNRQYRGVDAPTDVLSFANSPDPDFPELEPHLGAHLGDIVISYPVAQQQATTTGHRTSEEVMLLTVHGTLHLLGFDHDTIAEKEEMWAVQQQVMAALGLTHVQPAET